METNDECFVCGKPVVNKNQEAVNPKTGKLVKLCPRCFWTRTSADLNDFMDP